MCSRANPENFSSWGGILEIGFSSISLISCISSYTSFSISCSSSSSFSALFLRHLLHPCGVTSSGCTQIPFTSTFFSPHFPLSFPPFPFLLSSPFTCTSRPFSSSHFPPIFILVSSPPSIPILSNFSHTPPPPSSLPLLLPPHSLPAPLLVIVSFPSPPSTPSPPSP